MRRGKEASRQKEVASRLEILSIRSEALAANRTQPLARKRERIDGVNADPLRIDTGAPAQLLPRRRPHVA